MSNLTLPEYEVVCLHCRRTLSGEEGGPFGILARGPTATLLRHCPGAYFRTRPISHSSTSLYSCVTSIRQLPVGLPLLCLSFTPNLITVILYTINSLSLNYLFSSRSWILSFRLLSPVIIKSRCRHYAFRICSYFVKCDIVDKGRLGDPLPHKHCDASDAVSVEILYLPSPVFKCFRRLLHYISFHNAVRVELTGGSGSCALHAVVDNPFCLCNLSA